MHQKSSKYERFKWIGFAFVSAVLVAKDLSRAFNVKSLRLYHRHNVTAVIINSCCEAIVALVYIFNIWILFKSVR